jgi:serine/threonine kinase 32
LIVTQRPFNVHRPHDELAKDIMKAQPKHPLTNPAVSGPCVRALNDLMCKDRTKRIGAAGWSTYTHHPFFETIDFEALEQKQIDPIFQPSADKTNFDATYDLEELLLEEAPLEARARRQKPREQLKEDATDKEIRADELHRMVETLFEPFDYTTVPFDRSAAFQRSSCNVAKLLVDIPGLSMVILSANRQSGSVRRRRINRQGKKAHHDQDQANPTTGHPTPLLLFLATPRTRETVEDQPQHHPLLLMQRQSAPDRPPSHHRPLPRRTRVAITA